MGVKITGRRVDFSSMTHLPNVDTMCSVLATTQTEMGIQPEMVEAEYDRMGKKVRRFKRSSDGSVIDNRTGKEIDFSKERDFPVISRIGSSGMTRSNVRVLKKTECEDSGILPKETKNQNKKSSKGIFDIGFNAWYDKTFGGYDDDEDDNDDYICEYCTDLGYSNKYKSYICDNCTKCESCSEFQSGKCDGCTYSKTRTGHLYSESLSIDQIVDPDDLELLKSSDDEDTTVRRKPGKFSILDY